MEAQAIVFEKPFAAAEEKFNELVGRLGAGESRRMTHSGPNMTEVGFSYPAESLVEPAECDVFLPLALLAWPKDRAAK